MLGTVLHYLVYWTLVVPTTIFIAILTGYISYRYLESLSADSNECDPPPPSPTNFVTNVCYANNSKCYGVESRSSKDRVVVSREVDQTLHRCIDHLLQYYFTSWYDPLVVPFSDHSLAEPLDQLANYSVQQLREILKNDLWTLLSCFIDRLYSVNYVNFMATSLTNRLVKHYQRLNQSRRGSLDSQATPTLSASLAQPLTSLLSTSQNILRLPLLSQSGIANSESSGRAIECHLASLLSSPEAEKQVLLQIAGFLLETLLCDANERVQCRVEQSDTLRQLFTELLASALHYTIERISSPSFINCQIVLLVQKYMPVKDLIDSRTSEMPDEEWDRKSLNSIDSEWTGERHLVAEMRHCVLHHRLDRLYELLDQCEEIDSLRSVRLHLVAEILDAAVVSYLQKNENEADDEPDARSSETGSEAGDGRSQTSSATSSLTTSFKKNFNFNANIDSKFKRLKRKNLQRLVSQLRYAKTVCEQKIAVHKRNLASRLHSSSPASAFDDHSQTMLEFSLNNELVESFSAQLNLDSSNSVMPLSSGTMPSGKRILRFAVVMGSEATRQCFARFLATWLVGGEQRSTWHQWQRDAQLADCSIYLLETWQTIQTAFHNLTHHFELYCMQPGQTTALLKAFGSAYLTFVTIFADSRFNFTFSKGFLQLPTEMICQLESFLLGDVELTALEPESVWLENSHEPQEASLEGLLMHRYLRVLIRLERAIYDCLREEFYPQFLISAEYDQMLQDQASSIDPSPTQFPTARWQQLAPPDECSLEDQLRSQKPLSRIWINGGEHMIDLTKNRQLLFHSLEFSLFGFLCIQSACRKRLSLKIVLNDILQSNSLDTSLDKELSQQLSVDLVELRLVLSQLSKVLAIGHCWLHADFTCQVSDLALVSTNDSKNEVDITFRVHTTALPTGLQHPSAPARCLSDHEQSRLVSHWAFQWSTRQSLFCLMQYQTYSATPLLRMLSFLARHQLGDYLESLFELLEGRPRGQQSQQEARLLEKLHRNLNRNMHETKQLARAEQRQQEQNRLKATDQRSQSKISFKRLLDREKRDESGDEMNSTLTVIDEENIDSNIVKMSNSLQQAKHRLEYLFSQLTANSTLTKSVGFVHLVQYETRPNVSETTETAPRCLRCQLKQQLFEKASDHKLADWLQLSLASALTRFAPEVHIHQLIRAENGQKSMPGLHPFNLASSIGARLWRSSARSLEGDHQSQQLLFLHARSMLSECVNAPELLDLLLVSCGHFADYLCSKCRFHLDNAPRKLFTAHTVSPSLRTFPRFRLFNIDPFEQNQSGTQSVQLAEEVMSTLSKTASQTNQINQSELSSPTDQVDLSSFASASHEDDDANLIEPLLQLIAEVFELKGTVTRTLRRTLMFAVGLFFGQTILSRPIKVFLQSIFSESNTMQWIELLDAYLERLAKSATSSNEDINKNNLETSQIENYLDDMSQLMESLREVEPEIGEDDLPVGDGVLEAIELDSNQTNTDTDAEALRERRLQVLAKQLVLASSPTFLHHLFGQANTATGLNKCFDSLQYQQLNKQLLYEFIEAFLLEYFPEFKKL